VWRDGPRCGWSSVVGVILAVEKVLGMGRVGVVAIHETLSPRGGMVLGVGDPLRWVWSWWLKLSSR
jgi:hypothetical protein